MVTSSVQKYKSINMMLPTTTRNSSKKARRASIHLAAMSVLSFVIGFLMSYDAAMQNNETDEQLDNFMSEKESIMMDGEKSDGTSTTSFPLTTLELLGTISIQQKQLYNKILPLEYGRFSSAFNADGLERIFQLTPLSKKRLIRKLMAKILLGRMYHDNGTGGNNAHDGERSSGRPIFHWVTTGDSAAAGHGNSYAHSYTSVLEETVRDIFRSAAGIRFVATNRAGDAWSGMELAMCMQSISGRDVDVLSWDFVPMTMDSSSAYGDPLSPDQGIDPLLFGERAGRVLPHLPFLFYLGLHSEGGAWEDIQKLETSGMGTNIMGGEMLQELMSSFPNYNNAGKGRNGAHAVNGLRCGATIDGKEMCSDPSQLFRCIPKNGADCANLKYDSGESCSNNERERYQTTWNNGWKVHRLKGRLLGFYMVEMLRLAAVELDILERQHSQFRVNPSAALDALRAEEEVEEFLFSKTRSSGLDNGGSGALESWNELKRKNSICLNAKAASMVSQKGNNSLLPKFQLDPPQDETCTDFLPFRNAYFQISQEDGWVFIDPLTSSQQIGISEKELQSGIALALCFKHCYGNQCSERTLSDLEQAPIDWEKVEMRVNDNMVTNMKNVGGCYILQGDSDGAAGNSYSGMKIRNHGDQILLLSSAIILY